MFWAQKIFTTQEVPTIRLESHFSSRQFSISWLTTSVDCIPLGNASVSSNILQLETEVKTSIFESFGSVINHGGTI